MSQGFLGHPFPAEELGLPCGRLTGPCCQGPDPIGIPRSTRASCDRGGCPLYPGDGGALPADNRSSVVTCRVPTACPCSSALHPSPKGLANEASLRVHCIHPSGLSQPVTPGWHGRPWAFTRSFGPRRYQRRTSGWGQALSTYLGLRRRHHSSTLLPASPLATCDLVSQAVTPVDQLGGE